MYPLYPHKRLLKIIALKAIMNYNINMKTKSIEEEWDVLTTFFPKGWEEMAYETRAITRRRKISNPEILLRVLLIHLADGEITEIHSHLCWRNKFMSRK